MKDFNDYDVAVSRLLGFLDSQFRAKFPSLGKHFYVENGIKYARIVSESTDFGGNRSALGFIVLKPTKGFVKGDILMAASWGSPATNFARGNIFEGNFERVTCHGVI